jgi:hypothetical protein
VIAFPDEIRVFPGSGMRAVNDSDVLTADTITIDPQPVIWGQTRATISGVQVKAIPEPAVLTLLVPGCIFLFAKTWN